MIVQGAFNLLFRPGLRADFRDAYEQYSPEYPGFLKVSSTTEPEQRATIMSGLSRLFERGDGEPIMYDDPKMGPQVVGVDKEFAGGFIVTRRTVEDDQYGKANQGSKWLAHAARMTYEYKGAQFLDDATTGTYFKGIDNKPICDAAHTLINSSSTVRNELATPVQLSLAGVSAMLDLWTALKDENGDPMRAWPDKLVHGTNPGDANTAVAIWNTDKEPFTADNTDNVIRRRFPKPTIIESHFKTDTKSYFTISSMLNDAHFVVRRAVTFDDTFDFDTDAAKYKCTTRFLVWFVDWRGWVGAFPT